MFRLTEAPGEPVPAGPAGTAAAGVPPQETLRDRLTRLLARMATAAGTAVPVPPRPVAVYVGNATPADIARVIGMKVPIWIRGTRLPAAVRAHSRTVTAPDAASA